MILGNDLFWSIAFTVFLFVLGILFILRYNKYDANNNSKDNPFAEMNSIRINYKYAVRGKPFCDIMKFFGLIMVALSLLFSIGILFHHWEKGVQFLDYLQKSITPRNKNGVLNKGVIAFIFLVPLFFAFVLFLIGYLYSKLVHSKFYEDLLKQIKKNYPEDFLLGLVRK